jgi:hypothetical protein
VRNGSTPKTLQTDLGAVEIRTPRDRDGSFEPRRVGKGQTRLAGLDDRILDLYAGGLSTRDISAHLAELYGVEIGRDTISRVTAAVMEDARGLAGAAAGARVPDRLLRRDAREGPKRPLGIEPRLLSRARRHRRRRP